MRSRLAASAKKANTRSGGSGKSMEVLRTCSAKLLIVVPEERVREVVRWVLSERDLPGHDSERMIERWAREQGAGVYSRNHHTGGLEHLEDVLVRTIFGREPAA